MGLLIIFPLLAGCGVRTGHVTGKVTYKGNPLPAGWLQFRPADPAQNAVSVPLKEDGSFEADLPAGEVTVTIDNRDWEPPPAAGAVPSVPANIPISAEARAKLGPAAAKPRNADARPSPKPGMYVVIPEKYYDLSTSGLKFTVTGRDQTQNFELVD
jgi:hypothetical protein